MKITTYDVIDRLHAGRVARVSVDGIAATVSTWLAELGAESPLAEDLARAARAGNWRRVYELGDWLSVDVMVAACRSRRLESEPARPRRSRMSTSGRA